MRGALFGAPLVVPRLGIVAARQPVAAGPRSASSSGLQARVRMSPSRWSKPAGPAGRASPPASAASWITTWRSFTVCADGAAASTSLDLSDLPVQPTLELPRLRAGLRDALLVVVAGGHDTRARRSPWPPLTKGRPRRASAGGCVDRSGGRPVSRGACHPPVAGMQRRQEGVGERPPGAGRGTRGGGGGGGAAGGGGGGGVTARVGAGGGRLGAGRGGRLWVGGADGARGGAGGAGWRRMTGRKDRPPAPAAAEGPACHQAATRYCSHAAGMLGVATWMKTVELGARGLLAGTMLA